MKTQAGEPKWIALGASATMRVYPEGDVAIEDEDHAIMLTPQQWENAKAAAWTEPEKQVERSKYERMVREERVAAIARDLFVEPNELSPAECFASADYFVTEAERRMALVENGEKP